MRRRLSALSALLLVGTLGSFSTAATADEVEPEDSGPEVVFTVADVRNAETDLDLSLEELAEFAASDEPKTFIEDVETGEIIGIYEGEFSEAAIATLD